MSATLYTYDREPIPLQFGLYPDNTPVVDLGEAWKHTGGQALALLLRPGSLQELVTGLLVAHAFDERGGAVANLLLPCVPGGRQDRTKSEGDWLCTLKYVAGLINARGFNRVLTVDPHSPATGAAIDRLHAVPVDVKSALYSPESYDAVVAPDAGAAARAGRVADALGVPLLQASKHRDPATNRLSKFQLPTTENLDTAHLLVVDDLCDGGATFTGLAGEVERVGATADLFVTHGLFTKGTEALGRAYRRIYATDSVDRREGRVTYVPVSEGLLDYV